MSSIFKWKIKKISFDVYGGYITYDEAIDKPFGEELLIAVAGFIFQALFLILFYILYKIGIIDNKLIFIIYKYSLSIFLFNLLPIIPLDGSKIMNVILNMIISFKTSLKLLNYISIIFLIIISIIVIYYHISIEISYIIILSFLIKNIITNFYQEKYIFNLFLFQRYAFYKHYNKYNYISGKNLNKIKRQKQNFFKINNMFYSERCILKERFDKNNI